MLIQFGHNDQPGKPGRSTDLAEARAAGAVPVLVTPLTRRTFEAGKLDNDLIPWADTIRRIATETRAPLLDLNADSAAAVQAMGEDAADRLAQLPKDAAPTEPGATEVTETAFAAPKLAFDRTHLGAEGAEVFAGMVTRELGAAVPALRPVLLLSSSPRP